MLPETSCEVLPNTNYAPQKHTRCFALLDSSTEGWIGIIQKFIEIGIERGTHAGSNDTNNFVMFVAACLKQCKVRLTIHK
jgi:hypothetical protein